jgi:hypothetical protein
MKLMKKPLVFLAVLALPVWIFAGILEKGDWKPTKEETQKALARIESFLDRPTAVPDRSKGEIKDIRTRLGKYRVQFVGITRHGRKLIWCNFFPAVDGKDEFPYWKKSPVEVSDGGSWFWQIDYDPAADQCANFASNGYA